MKNYGLNIKDIEIKPEDYLLGSSLPLDVVNEDADWEAYLPQYELQAENFETFGCTVWGTLNQTETYHKAVFGTEPNYSERYIYNIVGINPPGSNPSFIYDAIRANGLVDQNVLPMTETLEEFYKPRPMEDKYLEEGRKWLDLYTIQHEWVRPSDPSKMKELIAETLHYSPVALSVTAWTADEAGYYVDNGQPNNHWCMCYGAIKQPNGIYLKIFDSYDHTKKVLHPSHNVSFAKRILLTKKNPLTPERTKTIFQVLLSLIKSGMAWIFPKWLEDYNTVKPVKPLAEPPPELPPVVSDPPPKYNWLTPSAARHSVRVICDEEGLTVAQKNLISSVINCESGYRFNATNENKKDGKVLSTDWGICQINDYWHIGKGKTFPSAEYVVNHPEECVRWMISKFKEGHLNLWVCYSSGLCNQFEA